MAAKFCCTVPERSTSPHDTPPRSLKTWKSLGIIKSPLTHKDQGFRPPISASLDDLELQRIFVSASLPEDHPDALRIPGRKPSLDESIIRSPRLSKKLRRQLSRKSFASGRSGLKSIKSGKKAAQAHSRKGIASNGKEQRILNIFSEGLGDGSLGFDPDALELSSTFLGSNDAEDAVHEFGQIEPSIDTRRGTNDPGGQPTALLRRSRSTSRSFSVPEAARGNAPREALRRSRSTSSLEAGSPFLTEISFWQLNTTLTEFDASWQLPLENWLSPASQTPGALSPVPEQPSRLSEIESSGSLTGASHRSQDISELVSPSQPSLLCNTQLNTSASQSPTLLSTKSPRPISQITSSSVHLYDMQISQHLRSPSQQTDSSSWNELNKPRNHLPLGHASLNSIMYSSMDSFHQRGISHTSFANPTASSALGQSVVDASSSVYSLRPSTKEELTEGTTYSIPYDIPNTPPCQSGDSKTSLKPRDGTIDQSDLVQASVATSLDHKAQTSCIDEACSRDPGHLEGCQLQATQSSRIKDPPSSLTKSSSSASLGRLSKFKEDLVTLPPAKSSKKRRSVLQLLFPRLARPKLRSVSSPLLCEKTDMVSAMFDGPSDDPNLLSVPGQSLERQQSGRSLSLNETQSHSPSKLSTSGSEIGLSRQRTGQTSLADYQLSLAVTGDDRRRKSAIDLEALRAAPEGDRREIQKPLRRALPLSGSSRSENTLMEKALHQHRLEKAALFRVSSRRIEPPTTTVQAPPVFNVSFGASAANMSGCMPAAMDDVDPLEPTKWPTTRRSQSMRQMRFSKGSALSSQPSTSFTVGTTSTTAAMRRPQSAGDLAAWSRFPSHTRAERCSTASREDNVISQDFAYPRKGKDQSSEALAFNTPSTDKTRKRNWVVRSRSITFDSVMRYYSNLFTSSAARNRRSSIAAGGRLEHPELEILPPIFPALAFGMPHYAHPSGGLVDRIKEEGHHLKEESQHLREEGHHLKEETQEILAHHSHLHHHYRISEEGVDPLSQASNDTESEHDSNDGHISPSPPRLQLPEDHVTLDGTTEVEVKENLEETEGAPGARRLSQMYQTYVRLPTSMDVTAEASKEEDLRDTGSPESYSGDSKVEMLPGLLAVPSRDHSTGSAGSAGTIVRRFPSVTVVDDRKGHWRSVSLVSVQSGKSIRNSTNDLLRLIKESENKERQKLMSAATDAE